MALRLKRVCCGTGRGCVLTTAFLAETVANKQTFKPTLVRELRCDFDICLNSNSIIQMAWCECCNCVGVAHVLISAIWHLINMARAHSRVAAREPFRQRAPLRIMSLDRKFKCLLRSGPTVVTCLCSQCCCFHLNWNQIKVISLSECNCAVCCVSLFLPCHSCKLNSCCCHSAIYWATFFGRNCLSFY